MSAKPIHIHSFSGYNTMHGGWSIITSWMDNGDGEAFTNQHICLSANCNAAEIQLYDRVLTPQLLRELANELESQEILVKNKLSKKSKKKNRK